MNPDPRVAVLVSVLGVAGARHVADCVAFAEEQYFQALDYHPAPGMRGVLRLFRAAASWDDDLVAGHAEGSGRSAEVPLTAVLAASSPCSPGSPVEWIGSKEAAGMLGCSDRNVRDLAARGTLTGHRLGRRLVLDAAEVAELAGARQAATAGGAA